MSELTLLSAFLLGLMGAGHCLGMCGGIIGSLSLSTGNNKPWLNVTLYQLGRISSYCLFGLFVGLIGEQSIKLTAIPILKILSASLLILMGLYISRIWMLISHLEKLGSVLWRKISPLSKKLLPVKNYKQALLLGALWGWLPCGLVYTSLGYALTEASAVKSSLFMLFFGLGTLPATLVAGAASVSLKKGLNHRGIRLISASLFIAFGIYSFYSLFTMGSAGDHHH